MVAIAVTIIVTITIWTALLYTMAFTPFSSTSVFLSLSMLTLVQSFELDEAYGISRKALKGEDLGQTPSRPLENLKKYLGNLTMGLALLFAIAVTVTALVIATAVVPSATASPVAAIVFSGMVVGIIIVGTIVALVACVHGISRQARGFRQIVENLRQWVRPLAVGLVAWGGTRFTRADLTDADFTRASLKGAHLYGATLTRTRFDLARQVNLARWGNSQPLP
jgi:ABC-type multidrug transport system fused ATPase/permease subunit